LFIENVRKTLNPTTIQTEDYHIKVIESGEKQQLKNPVKFNKKEKILLIAIFLEFIDLTIFRTRACLLCHHAP